MLGERRSSIDFPIPDGGLVNADCLRYLLLCQFEVEPSLSYVVADGLESEK